MTEGSNPWVSRPQTPTEVPSVAQQPLGVAPPRGPVAPQRGVPAPDHVDQLPAYDRPPAALWWVGVHGGSGESSLAALVPEWRAADHAWPRVQAHAPAQVVLAARSNVRGLRAAQAAATQWAAGLVPFVEVVGLVIIADAPGRLPRPLRDLAQVVAGGFPRTWNVPWIESWRLGEAIALPDAPREVRRLVDELSTLLRPGAAGTTQ